MTPAEPQSKKRTRDDSPRPAGARVAQSDWSLTQQAFDKLLAAFSPDRDEAAKQYEITRAKLIRFFEWRGSSAPDYRADETLNRVARKLDEGQHIENLIGYVLTVAGFVFKESRKEHEREPLPIEIVDSKSYEPQLEDDERETRLQCLDRCLEELRPESRDLIMEYYSDKKRAKIEIRKQMAQRLKIAQNALRIRALRIRDDLEDCVIKCLNQPA